MQYLVLAYDGTDPDAQKRRLAARPAHLAMCEKLAAEGREIIGGALVNEKDEMTGSYLVVDFADRAALDAWLATDPYVTAKVWQRIEITPCKIAPPFAHVLAKK